MHKLCTYIAVSFVALIFFLQISVQLVVTICNFKQTGSFDVTVSFVGFSMVVNWIMLLVNPNIDTLSFVQSISSIISLKDLLIRIGNEMCSYF